MKTILLLTLHRQATAWCTAEGCQNEFERPLADYTKYTEGDTYASACYAKFELHHTEPYLYVRGNSHSYDSKPTDHFADSGICGAREMGDRVTYLRFDVRDLSEDAVAHLSCAADARVREVVRGLVIVRVGIASYIQVRLRVVELKFRVARGRVGVALRIFGVVR